MVVIGWGSADRARLLAVEFVPPVGVFLLLWQLHQNRSKHSGGDGGTEKSEEKL